MLMHILHILVQLLLNKTAKGFESELPEAYFLDNSGKLLEGKVRVHVIFYSLSCNVDILSVDLHWEHHFSEHLHNKLCLNNPLFGRLVNVAVVLEQSIKDLFLALSQLDVIRVCLFLRVRGDTDSTG